MSTSTSTVATRPAGRPAVDLTLFDFLPRPAAPPTPEPHDPCPHCGVREVNAYVQQINHTPLRGTCTTLALRRAHEAVAA